MEKKDKTKKITKKKIILLIVLAIFIIFVIITASKMIIISNLKSKMSEQLKQNNSHMMITTYEGDTLKIAHSYRKDNKEHNSMLHFDTNIEKKVVEIDSYKVGDTANVYIDNDGEKFVMLNSDSLIINFATNEFLYEDNFGETLKQAIFTSIKTEKCNGKDCYYLSSLILGDKIYIDKETGLPVRRLEGTSTNELGEITNIVEDYKYEFGTVTDENFKEPDRTKYKINEE